MRFQDTLSKCWRETGVIIDVLNKACIVRSNKGYIKTKIYFAYLFLDLLRLVKYGTSKRNNL